MRKRPKGLARIRVRIAVCVFVGILISLMTAIVPSVIGNVDHVGFDDPMFEINDPKYPKYLEDRVPEFRGAVWCAQTTPLYNWQRWLDSSISFNEYYYGEPFISWDRSVHGNVPPGFTVRRGSYGFPFRSLYSDEYLVATDNTNQTLIFLEKCRQHGWPRGGIWISGLPTQGADRSLPTAPHWGGFILNTMLYGGIPGLFLVVRVLITRVHRLRKQLCLFCGYEIEDLEVCPECGQTHPNQAAA